MSKKKPIDILARKPGQCAAIMRSEGLIHFCCGAKVDHDNPRWASYCTAHLPVVPLDVAAEQYAKTVQRRFARNG